MSAAVATAPPRPQRSGCSKCESCRNSARSGLRGRRSAQPARRWAVEAPPVPTTSVFSRSDGISPAAPI
jgi:hypothetical protein